MNHQTLLTRLLAAMLLAPTAWAQTCPSWPTAQRFTYNAAGDEVTDTRTGLVWARCSVGETWSGGRCAGSLTRHTHEAALTLAQAANGWRLPNVKELASLADKGCNYPAIDRSAFPGLIGFSSYWSSTPYFGNAWYVFFNNGSANVANRNLNLYVRLVRASQ